MHVAVDVGGTFTDFVVLDDELSTFKVPTGERPRDGVLDGLGRVDPDQVTHASTVAANALIEDTGDVALVTTQGFADVVEIGTQARLDLYDLDATKPPSLVPPELRYEVEERIDADGSVVAAPDSRDLDRLAADLDRVDVDAVAVATLFSHVDPDHERQVAERLRRAGHVVSASHRIAPEPREYPRTVTTVADAKVKKPVTDYVRAIEDALDGTPLALMQSHGGLTTPDRYLEAPIRGVLSGPAAGVAAADHVADLLDLDRVLTLDMGGTSADLARIGPAGPQTTREFGFHDLPIRVPAVDVHTLGAGGGSIADLDAAGALTVGPESAGSDPGPACYGRGGTEPTLTDADLLAGRIDPGRFAADLDLAVDRARSTVEDLAKRAGLDVAETVAGIAHLAETQIAHGARRVTVEEGHDPRSHALIAYGGAGPLHACRVAEEIGTDRVVVPPRPGVFSALGLLVAEPVAEEVQGLPPTTDLADVEPVVDELTDRARRRAKDLGGDVRVQPQVLLRYVGQGYAIATPIGDDLRGRFHELHRDRRGHRLDQPIEAVGVRVRATATRDPPKLPGPTAAGGPSPVDRRHVAWGAETVETPAYLRDDLPEGWTREGPAIVHDPGSTCAVPPGWRLRRDATGALVLEGT